jgi:phage host-nuclease inhibitor protein Gam
MKTAVEYLLDEIKYLNDMGFDFGDGLPNDLIRKSKEMEKEQIIDAIQFGDGRGKIKTYSTAEQYYNETFKSE